MISEHKHKRENLWQHLDQVLSPQKELLFFVLFLNKIESKHK